MKKVLAIVLAALLIVAALAGCAAKSETADTTVDHHRYRRCRDHRR